MQQTLALQAAAEACLSVTDTLLPLSLLSTGKRQLRELGALQHQGHRARVPSMLAARSSPSPPPRAIRAGGRGTQWAAQP